nr:MAG: hypothetical protein [Bacteriophage sp.]
MYQLYEATARLLMDADTMEDMHRIIREYNAAAPFMATVETLENAPRATRYPKRLRRDYSEALFSALRRWQIAEQYRL